MPEGNANVTGLLNRLANGDRAVEDELYGHIYEELHGLARRQVSRESPANSLQPTALLHEAFLSLTRINDIEWANRGHFFAVAAKAMRRILIDHARQQLTAKRGGAPVRVQFDDITTAWDNREFELIALDRALERLELVSPRAYKVVELRFFAGLTFEDAAKALSVSSRTLKRDWELAKTWLYREIAASEDAG